MECLERWDACKEGIFMNEVAVANSGASIKVNYEI